MKNVVSSKRSQVTLFIIIAIVIVAVIFLLFYSKISDVFVPSTPEIQLQSCVEDELEEAIELVSARGGSIEPEHGFMYGGENIEYLCYTNEYYQTCSNQQPLLKQHIEREILDYIEPEAKNCIENNKQELRPKTEKILT